MAELVDREAFPRGKPSQFCLFVVIILKVTQECVPGNRWNSRRDPHAATRLRMTPGIEKLLTPLGSREASAWEIVRHPSRPVTKKRLPLRHPTLCSGQTYSGQSLKFRNFVGSSRLLCSLPERFQIPVLPPQPPYAQRGFDLDAQRHLGLAEAPLGEIDGDLGEMKTQLVSHESHFDLEDIAIGAHAFQRHGFQSLPPPQAEPAGRVADGQAQDGARVVVAERGKRFAPERPILVRLPPGT